MRQKINYFSFRFLFPLFLFLFGAYNLFNYLKAGEFGITNLDVRGDLSQMVSTRSGELLKGDKVWGTFHSKYTHLGLLSVRFYNQDRDSKDTLVFRLKEVGQEKWFYETKYETDQFLPHKHFPFGFPVIKNSDGKNYVFELESLRGATGSGILVDNQAPVFIAKSSFPKADLLKDKKLQFYFLKNKILNIFGDADILFNAILFFLPYFFYMIYLSTEGVSFQLLTGLVLAFVFYDVFWLTKSFDFLYISVIFLWGITSRRFHFESRIAAVIALIFLALTPVMLLFGEDNLAEKTAVWAYLFLCVTVAQQIYELKVKKFKTFSLRSFVRELHKFSISADFWVYRIPPVPMRIITASLISIFGYVLIFLPISSLVAAFHKFAAFYPSDYVFRFFITLLIPVLIFLSLLVLITRKIVDKSKFFIVIVLIIFNFVTSKITAKAIEFENFPRITSISPSETTEAWTDVVVNGRNFRDVPFVGKIYIDGVEQGEYLVYWSNEKIIFRTSPQITKTGSVWVEPIDRKPSNKMSFKYLFK